MVNDSLFIFAAQNYSCDTYGQNNYGECAEVSTEPVPANGGILANTGYEIIIPAALALALIAAAAILLGKIIKRRLSRK